MARVLVIDDEADVRRACTEAVRDLGHTPFVARDGVEAIRAYDRYRPDAVILDLRLPTLDGYQVLDHIRAGDRSAPVIVVSGDATGKWSLRRGATAFLEKPFDVGKLSAAITSSLTQTH